MPTSLPDHFTAAMAQLGPFPHAPHLAVAVSGGADSMALALLAHRWAAAQGGRITALTVDHGLRPESTAEAAQVSAWLRTHAIAHQTLPVTVARSKNLQANARNARYAALTGWCNQQHVWHLLTAHHAGDLAETYLLRQQAGSGPHGLAGISAARSIDTVRLLRPLLGCDKTALQAWLREQGQPWAEDPSNQNLAFDRVRFRQQLAAQPDQQAEILRTLAIHAATRQQEEHARATAWAAHVTVHPAGYISCARTQLDAPLLDAALQCVGGGATPLRSTQIATCLQHLRHSDKPTTLGGCYLLPQGETLLILRELAAIAPAQPLAASGLWDERFAFRWAGEMPAHYRLGALGEQGWHALRAQPGTAPNLPRPVLPTLPALWHLDQPVAVPHIHWADNLPHTSRLRLWFSPRKPLAAAAFTCLNTARTKGKDNAKYG